VFVVCCVIEDLHSPVRTVYDVVDDTTDGDSGLARHGNIITQVLVEYCPCPQ